MSVVESLQDQSYTVKHWLDIVHYLFTEGSTAL